MAPAIRQRLIQAIPSAETYRQEAPHGTAVVMCSPDTGAVSEAQAVVQILLLLLPRTCCSGAQYAHLVQPC